MRPLVTIGIPMYNSEKFIQNALDSALNQTYPNIEIIIVDDCSTDNSVAIVNKNANENPRGGNIRLIKNTSNQHVAAVRNIIIDKARGKYIAWLDSDDELIPDSIEKLVSYAEQYQAEIVIGSYKESYVDSSTKESIQSFSFYQEKEKFALCQHNYSNVQERCDSFNWNKLYLKDIVIKNGIKYRPFKCGEDIIFNKELFPYIESYCIIPDIVYNYKKRSASLSGYNEQTINLKEFEDRIQSDYYYLETLIPQSIGRPYFGDMVTTCVKFNLFNVLSICRYRKKFLPQKPTGVVNRLSRHPLTLSQIVKLDKSKAFHIAAWIFGYLPYTVKCFVSDFYSTMFQNRHK